MNTFAHWTPEMVAANNARVSGRREGPKADGVPNQRGNGSATEPPANGGIASSPASSRQFVIAIAPCPAPRMTRRDKWLKPRRPCVQRYFDFRDRLRAAVGILPPPDELHCRFFIAMPASWPQKKRTAMEGQPHRTRPDRDNLDKAVCDALFSEDGGVWKGSQEKRWAITGRVELNMKWS